MIIAIPARTSSTPRAPSCSSSSRPPDNPLSKRRKKSHAKQSPYAPSNAFRNTRAGKGKINKENKGIEQGRCGNQSGGKRCSAVSRSIIAGSSRRSRSQGSRCSNASRTYHRLAHDAEQFLFQDELALLVFLARLVCLVILPPYRFLALSAGNIAHDVSAGSHAPLDGFRLGDVHNVIEEVGFAMLAAEILYSMSGQQLDKRCSWSHCRGK